MDRIDIYRGIRPKDTDTNGNIQKREKKENAERKNDDNKLWMTGLVYKKKIFYQYRFLKFTVENGTL